MAIRFAAETHLHADFVSGTGELATATDAQIVASAGAQLAMAHRAVTDGDEIDLGGLTLQVVATPGHTPEHVAAALTAAAGLIAWRLMSETFVSAVRPRASR